MKKTWTKVLSVALAIVMLFSTMVSASAAITGDKITADPAESLIQGYIGNGKTNADTRNATLLLDFLDETLKGADLVKKTIDLGLVKITIDLTSVNGILKTLDTVKDVSGTVKGALNQDSSLQNLNTDNWTKGQTREKTGDVKIINNLIAFVADNKAIIRDVVDGSFKCGYVGKEVLGAEIKIADIDEIVKDNFDIDTANLLPSLLKEPDGLYGKIKGILAGLVYDQETEAAKYNAAKAKTVDKIIFEELMTVGLDGLLKKADDAIKAQWVDVAEPNEVWSFLYNDQGFKFEGALSAFTFDKSLNADKLIANIANVIWNYAKPHVSALLTKYGATINEWLASNEYAAPFAKFIDFTKPVNLDFTSNSVKDINGFFGQILAGIAPSYTGWTGANLGENLENLFVWGLKNRDTTVATDPYAGIDTSSFDKCALSLAKIIVRINVHDDATVAQMDACTSATQVLTKLLPFLMNKDAAIVSAKSTTWEQVLGDIVGYYINDYVPLYTDAANTKRYAVSSATSVWDVLNFAANFYMVDLNLDSIFGLEMKKTDTFLAKLDKIQAVAFGTTFTKTSVYIPKLLNDILALNLSEVVGVDIENSIIDVNTGEVNPGLSASNFVYKILDNVIKAIVGQSIFASGSFSSIDALLKNAALGASVEKLVAGLNSKKGAILPIVLYFVSVLTDKWNFEVTIGNNNAVTVKYGGKTLTKGTDYTVSSAVNVKGKSTKVTVKGAGQYSGAYIGVSNCTSHVNKTVVTKATAKKDGVITTTCSRCGKVTKKVIPYPKTVTLAKTSYVYTGSAFKPAVTVKGSDGKVIAAANYTVAYTKNVNAGTATATITFKGDNYSGKITKNFTIKPASAAKATVKVAAQAYTGKALTPAPTVTLGKVTLKKGTDYTVKYANNTKIGTASATITFIGNYKGTAAKKATFKINPAQVKGLKVKAATKTAITLTWTKVAGAKKYEVYGSTDGKTFKLIASPTANTLKVTKVNGKAISAGKTYKFKVIAVSGSNKGAASAVFTAGTQTAAPTVTVKNSSRLFSYSVTASWKKVAGAKSYIVYKSTNNKTWTKVKATTAVSYKISASRNQTIYVKVVAVNTNGINSAASKVVKAKAS